MKQFFLFLIISSAIYAQERKEYDRTMHRFKTSITDEYWQFEWGVRNNENWYEERFNYSVENGILFFVNKSNVRKNHQYTTVLEFYDIENGRKLNLKSPEDLTFLKTRVRDSLFLLEGSIINLYTGKTLVEFYPFVLIYSTDGLIRDNVILVRDSHRLYTYDVRNRKIIWEKQFDDQINYIDKSKFGVFCAEKFNPNAFLFDEKTGELKQTFYVGEDFKNCQYIGKTPNSEKIFISSSCKAKNAKVECRLKYIDLEKGSVHEFGNAEYMYADSNDLYLYNYWATYKVDIKTMKITDTLYLPTTIFLMYDNYVFCHGIDEDVYLFDKNTWGPLAYGIEYTFKKNEVVEEDSNDDGGGVDSSDDGGYDDGYAPFSIKFLPIAGDRIIGITSDNCILCFKILK
jgi:hypothetical protein